MKKILLLTMLAGAVQVTLAKKVKFAVNMLNETVNITGVHVMGDFQTIAGFPNGNWQPGTTACTQENGGPVYSVVVDIPAHAKYEFIFVNGDQSYEVEFVPVPSRVGYNFNDNRWVYIDSTANDTTLIGPLMFSGNAPSGLNLVRFRVDMSQETVGYRGVHVGGSFDVAAIEPTMYSFDGKVYEHIAYVSNGNYDFKYANWDTLVQFESLPSACSNNAYRGITVAADTVLGIPCFNSCTACIQAGADEVMARTVSIFPNPFSDEVMIDLGGEKNIQATMSDVSGRTVYANTLHATSVFRIKKENLPSGVYFLKISDQASSSVHKLVVQ